MFGGRCGVNMAILSLLVFWIFKVFLGALDFFFFFFLKVKEGKQETPQTHYLIGWKTGLTSVQ